jgi:hypothetical protein
MADPIPPCPRCGQSDKTYKVSLLYLESSAKLNRQVHQDQPQLERLITDFLTENRTRAEEDPFLTKLIQMFAPPSGEKRFARRIHPDGMVAFFTLLAIFLLYRMAADQPASFTAAAFIFAAAVGLYLFFRKTVIHRYESSKREEQEANSRVEREVSRWMRLYFCSRDQAVFYPDHSDYAPAEQIRSFLREA